MALTGNLQDIDLFSLIQVLCQDGRATRVIITQNGCEANLFLEKGKLVHATLGDLVGEEAIFPLLAWEQGNFKTYRPVSAPTQTIFSNWAGLLLEGARRLDESQLQVETAAEIGTTSDVEPGRSITMTPAEEAMWARRAKLADVVHDLTTSEVNLKGVLLVSNDGLTLASEILAGAYEPAKIGALSAGLMGMGQRSAHQLKYNFVEQIIVKAEQGYILVLRVNPDLLLIGLMSPDGNLDMVLFDLKATIQRLVAITE